MEARLKVAIVGTAPSMVAAPVDDASYDIWTVNGSWELPRSDVHFEMHRHGGPAEFAEVYGAAYVAWLGRRSEPTYMTDVRDWVPSSRALPIGTLTEAFGEMWRGGTVPYMLALAILKGYVEVALCGVEMVGNAEYLAEREYVQYFRGIALGRGIKVTFPGGSGLEKCSVRYGYDKAGVPEAAFAALERERKLAEQAVEHADAEMQRAEGSRATFAQLLKNCPDGDLRELLTKGEQAAVRRRDKALTAKLSAGGAVASTERSARALGLVAVGGAA